MSDENSQYFLALDCDGRKYFFLYDGDRHPEFLETVYRYASAPKEDHPFRFLDALVLLNKINQLDEKNDPGRDLAKVVSEVVHFRF